MPTQLKEEKESDNSGEANDQFSDIYGDWGRWQTLCFLLVGFTVIFCSQPTLIMTFMNAKIDFWCKRPENLMDLDIQDWRALTGGMEDNCQIVNITYGEMTAIEAKRWVQDLPNTLISNFLNST